jgi:L-threonylcarbamoyladenylate synthase
MLRVIVFGKRYDGFLGGCFMTLKISHRNKIVYEKTAEVIENGGIAIIPTDTVYGFAVNAFDLKPQKLLYKIKGRSNNKPLILMAHDIESVNVFTRIPHKVLKIVRKFWPGQLTLVFPTTKIGKILSGGRTNLGVRIPASKFVLDLLKNLGKPIFTTSVNVSKKISAKNINEASNFDGMVDIMVDGGQSKFSFESTIIDVVKFPYVIVREGCLDVNEILKYI